MNQCNLDIVYTLIEWANKITLAERDCVQYIKDHSLLWKNGIALDVGFGASHFYKELHSVFMQIDGLTVIDKEMKVARKIKGKAYYNLVKVNKYDVKALDKVLIDYDVIVDVNPKQHGCCHQHWEEYFLYILGKVKDRGVFLTHTTGFGQYEGFRTELLSLEELNTLSSMLGMKVETIPSIDRPDHSTVIISRKKDV
jgi:cyclopropane fatty-acyl-phospholipid synthase-like methyltransferase